MINSFLLKEDGTNIYKNSTKLLTPFADYIENKINTYISDITDIHNNSINQIINFTDYNLSRNIAKLSII